MNYDFRTLVWLNEKIAEEPVKWTYGGNLSNDPSSWREALETDIPGTPSQYHDYEMPKQNKWYNPFTWRILNKDFARSQDGVVKARANRISQQLHPHTKSFLFDVHRHSPNIRSIFGADGISGSPFEKRDGFYRDPISFRRGEESWVPYNPKESPPEGASFWKKPSMHVNVNQLIGESDEKRRNPNRTAAIVYHEGTHALHNVLEPEDFYSGDLHKKRETIARLGEIRGQVEGRLGDISGYDSNWLGEYPLKYSHTPELNASNKDIENSVSSEDARDYSDLIRASVSKSVFDDETNFWGDPHKKFPEFREYEKVFNDIWNKKNGLPTR